MLSQYPGPNILETLDQDKERSNVLDLELNHYLDLEIGIDNIGHNPCIDEVLVLSYEEQFLIDMIDSLKTFEECHDHIEKLLSSPKDWNPNLSFQTPEKMLGRVFFEPRKTIQKVSKPSLDDLYQE